MPFAVRQIPTPPGHPFSWQISDGELMPNPVRITADAFDEGLHQLCDELNRTVLAFRQKLATANIEIDGLKKDVENLNTDLAEAETSLVSAKIQKHEQFISILEIERRIRGAVVAGAVTRGIADNLLYEPVDSVGESDD